MEQYYVRRLRNFANGRCDKNRLILKAQIYKASYLSKEMITQQNEYCFKVPSEKSKELYDVDLQVGYCSCESGKLGSLCKHQAGVYYLFLDINEPTTDDRYNIAILALGDKANKKEFYTPMAKNNDIIDNLSIVSKYPENTPENSTSNDHRLSREDIPHREDVASGDVNDSTFSLLVDKLKIKHQKFGTSSLIINRCLKRLEKVKSRASWDVFLSTFGTNIALRQRSGAAIHVQPTAIARRKAGVTRGSKRLPCGRPPSSEVRLTIKRKRNLAANVRHNMPNAKSHGTGH